MKIVEINGRYWLQIDESYARISTASAAAVMKAAEPAGHLTTCPAEVDGEWFHFIAYPEIYNDIIEPAETFPAVLALFPKLKTAVNELCESMQALGLLGADDDAWQAISRAQSHFEKLSKGGEFEGALGI